MTHILIPSSFKEDTLHCLHEVAQTFPGLKVKVVLFHAFGLSSSITDLLMLARRCEEETLIPPSFLRKCWQLTRELEEIVSVEHRFFYGTTLVSFRNFLQANKIEFAVLPSNYQHEVIGKLSQSPLPFLEKSGLPLISVTPQVPQPVHAMEQA